MDITELGVRVVSRGAVQELDALEHASDRAGSAGERMVSIFESVKRRLEVLGLAFGIREALRLANDVREAADQYEKLGAVAQRTGAIHGIAAQEIMRVEGALRAEGASMIEARDVSVALLRANLDLASASKLLSVAQDVAAQTGLTEAQAMDELILAMQTGMDRTLKHAGIQLDLVKATARVAASLGVATNQLSQQRLEQIRLNAILQAAAGIQGAHAAALSTTAGRAEEARKVFSDLKLVLGTLISNAVTGTLESVASMLRGIRDWVKNDTESFIKFVDALKAIATGIGVAGAAWLLYTGYAKAAAAITAIIGAAETIAAFIELAKGIRTMADAMALFELAAAPVLITIAAIGAVVAYKFFSKEIKQQVEDFTKSVFGLGDALKTVGGGGAGGGKGGIQSSVAALQRLAQMQREFPAVIQGLRDIATATRNGSDETTKYAEREAALNDAIVKATHGLVGHDAAMAADLETQKFHAQWVAEDTARMRDASRAIQDQVLDAEHQVRALGFVGRALEEQNIRWKEAKAVQDAYRSGFDVEARVAAAHRVAAAELEVLDITRKQVVVRNLLSGVETAFTSFWSDLTTKGADAFRNLATTIKNIFGGVVADIAKQFFEMNILPKLASIFGLNAQGSGAQNMTAAVTMQTASTSMLTASLNMITAANTMAGTPGNPGAGQLPPVTTTGGGRSWTQMGGVGIAGFGVGYGIGSMTSNRGLGALGGAAGGALTGAMIGSVLPGVGTAIGAVVGGLTGLVGGLLGSGAAARRASEEMHRLQDQLKLTMDAFRATVANDQLALAIAQIKSQLVDLLKQIDAALPGKRNEAERNRQRDEATRLEQQREQQIRQAFEDQKRFAAEDLQVRLLRSQGRASEADAMAFAIQQQQEYAQAVKDGADATYLATLTQVQAAEKLAHALGILQTATHNAPSGFYVEQYIEAFVTRRTGALGPPTPTPVPNVTYNLGGVAIRTDGVMSGDEILNKLKGAVYGKAAAAVGINVPFSAALDSVA